MNVRRESAAELFRVWIAAYRGGRPRRWDDVPPLLKAVEPIDERCLNAGEARQVVEGFNRRMLRGADALWAVAVPVAVRLEGEPRRGSAINRNASRQVFGTPRKRRRAS